MMIRVYGLSDKGLVRERNEDCGAKGTDSCGESKSSRRLRQYYSNTYRHGKRTVLNTP